jgi:transposase-like protein
VEYVSKKRIYRTKEFKFKIAIEAIKGQKQISELAEEFNVHPNQISKWKTQLLEKGADVFSNNDQKQEKNIEEEKDFLFRKVGEQTIHIDWLKKKLGITE